MDVFSCIELCSLHIDGRVIYNNLCAILPTASKSVNAGVDIIYINVLLFIIIMN